MKRAPSPRSDFPVHLLLLLILLTSAERLVATTWTEGLGITLTMAVLGMGLGLALGYSRFKRTGIYLLTIGYSLIVVPWMISTSQYPGGAWQENIANVGGRLGISFSLFLFRQPVEDPILFITFAAVLYWIISLHAAFALSRKESFAGIVLLPGISLFIVQLYDNGVGARIGLLAFYFFLSLLMLGRLRYLQKRREWVEQRVWFSADSTTDLNIALLLATLIVILLAWIAPNPSRPADTEKSAWENITKPLDQLREDLGNAVAGLEHGSEGGPPTADLYGDALSLGTQGATGDTVLFIARVPTTLGIRQYYWQVRTYDLYSDNQWHATAASKRTVTQRRPPIPAADSLLWPTAGFEFSFPSKSFSILIAPPRPVWISRPASMTYLPLLGETEEPLLFTVNPVIQPGETYAVHAAVANPTEVQLRAASTEYPTWVTQRYLQLPEDFPQRITDLAREITADSTNPYDQVNAITNYLRNNITYNRQVSFDPQGGDPMVWFLFTSKEGFCNYYATAEVLMLRSIGIPARLAVGFAEGEKENPDRRIVRQRDAHAWPEVYFPGLGWVEFEPTTFIAAIVRPSGIEATPLAGENLARPTPLGENNPGESEGGVDFPLDGTGSRSGLGMNSMQRIILFLVILFSTIALIGFLLFVGVGEKARRRLQDYIQTPLPVRMAAAFDSLSLPQPVWLERWVRLTRMNIVERSFETVHRSLRWLGAKPSLARTPAQAAALLTSLLPASAEDIQLLLREYEHTLFSPRPGDGVKARRASESVRSLAFHAALTRQLDRVKRLLTLRGRRSDGNRSG